MPKTAHPSKKIIRVVADTLLIVSTLGTLIISYPIIRSELSFRFAGPTLTAPVSDDFSITIPAIGVNSRVISNVDPFNQAEYNQALKQGVAHAQGTTTPDLEGSTYLFAHSSGNPWELTYKNPEFFRLSRLVLGDNITLTFKGRTYQYRVSKLLTVKPSQIEYLINQKTHQLILQTCTPIGTDWNRLLVFATPV